MKSRVTPTFEGAAAFDHPSLAARGAATSINSYPEVAKVAGAVWMFLPSMTVSMPPVTSFVEVRITAKEGARNGH